MLKILSVAIVGVALFLAFGPSPVLEKRILFIGNSYTFGGDIPVQVKNIAMTSSPAATYHVDMVVRGGTSLEQHLTETNALAKIQEGNWDVVVLQDSSVISFRPKSANSMEQAAIVLAHAAQQQGADVLYFAHWAPGTQAHNKPEAIRIIEQTYQRLAQDTGGRVARAGRVWQIADDAGLEGLYSADEHHSSVKGAFAAALAIVVALGDVDVNTSRWAPEEVPLDEQKMLRTAAATLLSDVSSYSAADGEKRGRSASSHFMGRVANGGSSQTNHW